MAGQIKLPAVLTSSNNYFLTYLLYFFLFQIDSDEYISNIIEPVAKISTKDHYAVEDSLDNIGNKRQSGCKEIPIRPQSAVDIRYRAMRKQNSKPAGLFENDNISAEMLNPRNTASSASGDNMFSLLYPTSSNANEKIIRSRRKYRNAVIEQRRSQCGVDSVILHGINSEGKTSNGSNAKYNIITGDTS